MKISERGVDLIKSFESLHDGDLSQIGLQPKKCPAGIWTEGYGIAMRDGKGDFLKGPKMPKGTITTEEEAEKQLANNLPIYENIVMRKVKAKLNQNQYDALVSYTFNTGGSDTLFKLINKGAPKDQIVKWFTTKYITSNGVRKAGLVRRRKVECDLFFE